jgi:hypothetical protein
LVDRDYDAEALASLTSHPAWDALRAKVERKMNREFSRMSSNLMRGDIPSVAQVHYMRGVFAGMKFLLDCPAVESRKLDRLLEREEVA